MQKIKTRAIFIYTLSKETIQSFLEEKAFFHGAALAYYALFSLFPLLFLCVSLLGRYLGEELILQVISDFLVEKVGLTNVDEIMKIVGSYNLDKGSVVMELIGLAVILFASSGFIHSLKNSINEFFNIQKAKLKGRKAMKVNVIEKLLSFLFLAVFASIFLVIYLFHSFSFTLIHYFFNENSEFITLILHLIDHAISILLNYLIFLMLFKYLHNGIVTWKAASMGALVTSVLLYLGQLILKYYLLNVFTLGSAGIAGSLFIFLAWVHYSSQIIFVGAKFTYTFSKRIGQPITLK
jgi:membrane protein